MPNPPDTRTALAAAFERLPLKPGMGPRVRMRVELLAPLANAGPGVGRATPMFRDANRATCAKELRCLELQAGKLAKLAKEGAAPTARTRAATMLLDTVRGLHQPTILALGDVGILGEQRYSLEHTALRLGDPKSMATKAEIGLLELASRRAKLADVSGVADAPVRGRPANNLAKGVVRILHEEFEPLTGKSPARTVRSDILKSPAAGDFFNLVQDVFVALGLDANPEAYARAVLEERKKRSP